MRSETQPCGWVHPRKTDRRGFTLVELIIAMLLAIPIVTALAVMVGAAAARLDSETAQMAGMEWRAAPDPIAFREAVLLHRELIELKRNATRIHVIGARNQAPPGQPALTIQAFPTVYPTNLVAGNIALQGNQTWADITAAGGPFPGGVVPRRANNWEAADIPGIRGSNHQVQFTFGYYAVGIAVVGAEDQLLGYAHMASALAAHNGAPTHFYRVRLWTPDRAQPREYRFFIPEDNDPLRDRGSISEAFNRTSWSGALSFGATLHWLRFDPELGRVEEGPALIVFPDPLIYTTSNELVQAGVHRTVPMSRFIYFQETVR